MKQHGLSPGECFTTDVTGTPICTMLLLEVPVQSLDEGCPYITEMTPPGLIVFMVSVHVVHQPSEAPALLATQLAETELLAAVGQFLLGNITHLSSQRMPTFTSGSASLSLYPSQVVATSKDFMMVPYRTDICGVPSNHRFYWLTRTSC